LILAHCPLVLRAEGRHAYARFLRGTFFPFLRASDRPMAIACLRLLTFLPLLPLFNVPRLRLRIARSTSFEAEREYFLTINTSLRAAAARAKILQFPVFLTRSVNAADK
jgi:hypothetical protein